MSFGKDNDPGSDWNLGQCSLGDPILRKIRFRAGIPRRENTASENILVHSGTPG